MMFCQVKKLRIKEKMIWLKEHLIAALLSCLLAVSTVVVGLLYNLSINQAVMANDITHINKSVNNVGEDDKTLRGSILSIDNNIDDMDKRMIVIEHTIEILHPNKGSKKQGF